MFQFKLAIILSRSLYEGCVPTSNPKSIDLGMILCKIWPQNLDFNVFFVGFSPCYKFPRPERSVSSEALDRSRFGSPLVSPFGSPLLGSRIRPPHSESSLLETLRAPSCVWVILELTTASCVCVGFQGDDVIKSHSSVHSPEPSFTGTFSEQNYQLSRYIITCIVRTSMDPT